MNARKLLLLLLVLSCAGQAWSHEVRPGFLQLTERPDHHYDVLWKQPTLGALAVHLQPVIDGGLLEIAPSDIQAADNYQIRLWRNLDAGPQGLEGRALHIEGLEQTLTDVLVLIEPLHGDPTQHILRPQAPGMTLHLGGDGHAVPASYVALGIEHILTGADHLAFVFGLILLVRSRMTLIKTITAFTVAHSITLAATTLHFIAPRPALVEALVALSILFLAVELVHHYRGRGGLAARHPALIAFTFGLLHGCAFAGALADIGLPAGAIPLALLLFNVGVELGQLAFIAAVLVSAGLLTHLARTLPAWTRWVPPYAIGCFAAFLFFAQLSRLGWI